MDIFGELLAPSESSGRLYGIAVGVVTNNQDPDGLARVKVRLPWLSNNHESNWARVLTPMAGPDRGLYFLPEVEDEVLVAFEHGNADALYVLGALWNGKDKPPANNKDGKNNLRVIKSRSGHVIRCNDEKGEEKIEIIDRSNKNRITIDTSDNSIRIAAEADISIQSSGGKLILKGNRIEIESKGAVKIQAAGNMDLKAGPQLNIKGQLVNIN